MRSLVEGKASYLKKYGEGRRKNRTLVETERIAGRELIREKLPDSGYSLEVLEIGKGVHIKVYIHSKERLPIDRG